MSILIGSISSKIEAKFDELWWGLSKGLMNIINMLEQAFRFVVGSGELIDEEGNAISAGGEDTLTYAFKHLFGSEGRFKNLYWQMVILFVSLMAIFVIIGVIRSQFTKEPTESIKKMVGTSFWSMFKMLLVPIFFFFALLLTAQIFAFLLNAMSGGSESTLAQTLCDCFCKDADAAQHISFNSSYDSIADIYLSADRFDFTLCILTSACLIVTIFTAVIAVTKRFIRIFMYYITAPMVLSKSMLDDGKSWELWKDNLLAQLLGAGGVIISMYLFIELVPIIVNIINETFRDKGQTGVAAILKIVFILGMSTVPASATAFVAQLVSQGSGQNESNDLMHTQQMLGNGMRLAGLAAGKVLSGALSSFGGGGAGAAGAAAGVFGSNPGATPTNMAHRSAPSGSGGGSTLGMTPAPLSGGGSTGGSGGSLGNVVQQSAAAIGGSDGATGGGFGGGTMPGAGLPGAMNGSPDGANVGNVGGGPSPVTVGGVGAEPMQAQGSLMGSAGAALASGSGAMGSMQRTAGTPPVVTGGTPDIANPEAMAQQAGGSTSSTEGESFGQIFKRDQKNSGLRHQGGFNVALFRGGVIGAVTYGAMRLVGRSLTAVGSVFKWLGNGIKKLVGKIPTKDGRTLGERWAEKSQKKAAEKQFKKEAKAQDRAAKQQEKQEKRLMSGVERAKMQDTRNAQGGAGTSGVGANEKKYIDDQLAAFEKKSKGLDNALSDKRFANVPQEKKDAYKRNMLGGDLGRMQRILGASEYGRSNDVQNRFRNIVSGGASPAASEGGEN